MSANVPVAFFAARDVDLPPHRVYTHLKVLGDPEYTVYVNGQAVAGRKIGVEERALDLYDLSELVQTGPNRLVIAVRAPQGLGGLLASIDIAPETENWVVTDSSWKIYRQWSPELLFRDVEGAWESPYLIGPPPIGRWNYLTGVPRAFAPPATTPIRARETFPVMGFIPTIRTEGGVAVAGATRARATVFDFGFTRGRVRLTIRDEIGVSRAVNLRFANARNELELLERNLRPLVFAPGEHVVTLPEAHSFRYLMVFGRGAVDAEVLP